MTSRGILFARIAARAHRLEVVRSISSAPSHRCDVVDPTTRPAGHTGGLNGPDSEHIKRSQAISDSKSSSAFVGIDRRIASLQQVRMGLSPLAHPLILSAAPFLGRKQDDWATACLVASAFRVGALVGIEVFAVRHVPPIPTLFRGRHVVSIAAFRRQGTA